MTKSETETKPGFVPNSNPAAFIEVAEMLHRLSLTRFQGIERRAHPRLPISGTAWAVEADFLFQPIGPPFRAIMHDISLNGIELIHTEPTTAQYLVVELPIPVEDRIVLRQVVIEVMRRRPIEPYHEIGGRFVVELH